MQILKVKTVNEFETAEVPAGSLLVFPELQTNGSYLWRCKDSDGNTGSIGSAGDIDAVAEDLSSNYGRPDSLLAQMMFFIRNGAVNLYATLSDLKNFFAGYFADVDHEHAVAEITDFEEAIAPKLDAELLAPTTAIYIDGNRSDDYTEDGSIARPYKTIAAATAAHQEPASFFIAKGTYAESTEINLYADSVIYGNYSAISGAAINIGQGGYIHNLMFYNTVNVAVNGNSPMFHYCRFMGATLNLDGVTDFDGCYISSATTFNVTMTAAGSIRAFNSSFNTTISSACRMYFNDCVFNVSSSNYAVTSTGGFLSMVACMVYNTSTGGGISCNNGANGISTYNFLATVATNKNIACGTAVTIIGGDVHYAALTGLAVVFPGRLQAALNEKLSANFSGIQAIVDGSDVSYYSTLNDLLTYLNTLDTASVTGVVLNFAPGDYSSSSAVELPHLRLVLNGNNSTLTATGNLSFSRNAIIRNFARITASIINLNNAFIENASLTGAVICDNDINASFVNITGNVSVTSSNELVFSQGTITGNVTSAGRLIMINAIIQGNSASPLVNSTAGSVQIMNAYVINTGSGGGVSCDNGATAGAPNSLANVQVFSGTIAAGSAVTFLGPLYTATAPTGSAFVNLGHGTISAAELSCLSGVNSPIQTQLDAKQAKVATHNLGTTLSGAISLNIANGNVQYGTLSGVTTLAYDSISGLEEGQSFSLQLNNTAGQSFSFTAETAGSITILDAGNTGCYKISFSKVDGKVYYEGKCEVYC